MASFAILGDASPEWRPSAFGWNLWGCRMGIDFPSVKLIDYLGREEELAASRNPFALMTQAFLSTRATRDDGEQRRSWKLRLVRRLYEQQYTAEEVRRIFRVIDWMMQLEPDQAIIFKDELEKLEAEKAKQYVTSVERIAKEQGRQEGQFSLLRLQRRSVSGSCPNGSAPSCRRRAWRRSRPGARGSSRRGRWKRSSPDRKALCGGRAECSKG